MQTNQSPTRRSAIGFSLAAMAAGLTLPALASAANPDAELIALCDQLVDLEKAQLRLYDTVKDDDERDRLIDPLYAAQQKLTPLVVALGNPKTIEGARAMARVALAYMPLDREGEREVGHDPEDWFFACIAEFLTGDVT